MTTAKKFTADVKGFLEKTDRELALIVASAAQEMFGEMTTTQPSVKVTGGTFEVGKVPVDTGFLINSQVTYLNGALVAQGEASYTFALAGLEIGDVIVFGFTASYAIHVEYGTSKMAGRYFVRSAVNGGGGWQGRIDRAAQRITGDA